VVDYLERLHVGERASIWKRLREITAAPDRIADYRERDARGRDLAVHVFHSHAILYWGDVSDSIHRGDGSGGSPDYSPCRTAVGPPVISHLRRLAER